MKIALVSTPFVAVPPRDYGGTELIAHELAEGLVARGHAVTLFATGDSRSAARLEHRYEVAQWPPRPLADLDHLSWAMARIAAERYDVAHVNGAAALAFGRLVPEVPLVYTIHHRRDEPLSGYYQSFPEVWFVAISERQRELEAPLPRITTVHHGLELARYDGPTPGGAHVTFMGRLSEVKGPHLAIDAAGRAGLEIVMAGSIHNDDEDPGFAQRELAPRLELPHVRYLGPVGMAQKSALLRGSRALLAPLLWEEPFGLVMLEAMLCGCPVIAFRRGSAPELIEEGVTGYLVADLDEMVELLRGGLPDFDRARCRAAAAEHFEREQMVLRYEAVYRAAIAARRRRRGRGGEAADTLPAASA